MDSSNICRGPATGWATHVTQINPHGVNPVKVATNVPILQCKTEAQRRRYLGHRGGKWSQTADPGFVACALRSHRMQHVHVTRTEAPSTTPGEPWVPETWKLPRGH